ncbi:chemotaxis protein CheA [bacterium]|nr:chemotaxis protein CheA [bacterium]
MVEHKDQDADKARKDFLGETESLLDDISLNLADLEEHLKSGSPRPDTINAIFRGVHSLKGLSGMLGFSKITRLTHDLESLLDEIRMGKVAINTHVLDFLYDCIDVMAGLTREIGEQDEAELIAIEPILTRIKELRVEKGSEQKNSILDQLELDPNIIKVLTEYEEYRLTDNIARRVNIFNILANFNFDTFDEELTGLNAHLRDIGEIITTLPSIEPISDTDIQFNLIIGTDKDQKWLEHEFARYSLTIKPIPYKGPIKPSEKRRSRTKSQITVAAESPSEEQAPETADPASQPIVEAAQTSKKASLVGKTVRVNLDKIDNVLHLIGELSISKSIIASIGQVLREQLGFYRANELLKTTRTLEKQILRLQSSVLETRMIPLDYLFSRLIRNTKKMAREMEKKIEIIIKGEETELDKMLVEELSDPLLHILRNAIDHGIETAALRKAAHKDETGQIRLSAYQRGNYVIIEIEDDGRGLDLDAIRTKALEQKLITKQDTLKIEEIQQLIFLPGFSTREIASEISGRGVGMDIVRKNISAMNGTIKVQSEPDIGTKLTISIPITMAILPALLVQVSDSKFAIPLTSISKSLKLFPIDIHTIEGREVLNYLGNAIPIVRLDRFFSIVSSDKTKAKTFQFAVIVHSADMTIALIVDRLLGRQDIVIKSLGKRLQNFPGIAGGTETGDEKLVLVLDIPSFILSTQDEPVLR